jgi:transcriptional regulator with XRE-family HTH domain
MTSRYLASRLRRALGDMTIAELSRRSNVSRSVISRILRARGYVNANRQDIANMATALGVTFEYLTDTHLSTLFVRAAPESDIARRCAALLRENDALRERRDGLLKWLGDEQLEIRRMGESYQIWADGEVIAEDPDLRKAVRLARGARGDLENVDS